MTDMRDPLDLPVIVATGDEEKDMFLRDAFARHGMTAEKLRVWMETAKKHAIDNGRYRELSIEELAAEEGVPAEELRARFLKRIETAFDQQPGLRKQ